MSPVPKYNIRHEYWIGFIEIVIFSNLISANYQTLGLTANNNDFFGFFGKSFLIDRGYKSKKKGIF